MNIVFLDSGTMPEGMPRPAEATQWTQRETTSVSEVVEALKEAEVAITNKVPISRAALAQLPGLRLICICATGFDFIDLAACRDHDVLVCNAPAYSSQSVAESVIMSIFCLRRSLLEYAHAGRIEWPDASQFCIHKTAVRDIGESTLGIVGRGDIGRAVASIAGSIGLQVLFAEHHDADSVREGYHAFDEVLARSDILSLHCPLRDNTRRLINRKTLAKMRSGAVLINTARGGLVDAAALASALDNGQLMGAAIDVLDGEPPGTENALLKCRHPNLIITPHVAWASRSSIDRLVGIVLGNISGFAAGTPKNVVT